MIERALEHDHPMFLLHTAAERLRWKRIVRPGLSRLEKIVSAAREEARKVTFEKMSHLLTAQNKNFLDQLLIVKPEHFRTPLNWLQRMPNDHTASQILETLEKIRYLKTAKVEQWPKCSLAPSIKPVSGSK